MMTTPKFNIFFVLGVAFIVSISMLGVATIGDLPSSEPYTWTDALGVFGVLLVSFTLGYLSNE